MSLRAIVVAVGLGLFAPACPRALDDAQPPSPPTAETKTPAPPGESLAPLEAYVAHRTRPESHRVRDRYRHPLETLTFCGVEGKRHVVEVWPGGQGGYYRRILEPYLEERDATYAPISQRDDPFPGKSAAAPDGAADLVLVFRAHGFVDQEAPAQTYVDALFRMLAPGGTFCIVDHAGDEAKPQDPKGTDGYVKESHFRAMAERAGFVLDATSDVNRNPRDTKAHPDGVYSLPPTLRGTEPGTPEQQKFLDIGESDRFTHRYTKPAAGTPAADVAAARAVFEENLKAIQNKNREDYLGTYRHSERLVRVGFDGPKLGFDDLASGTAPTGSDEWPEKLVADDVQLHPVAPGVVYGSYKYTVTFDGVTTSGLSERVFLKEGGRWFIAVTTAFEGPPAKQDAE